MNLLLLLSALLSALTGAQGSARAAQPAVAVAQAVSPAVLVRRTPAALPTRPRVHAPTLRAVGGAPLARPAPAPQPFLDSRRE